MVRMFIITTSFPDTDVPRARAEQSESWLPPRPTRDSCDGASPRMQND